MRPPALAECADVMLEHSTVTAPPVRCPTIMTPALVLSNKLSFAVEVQPGLPHELHTPAPVWATWPSRSSRTKRCTRMSLRSSRVWCSCFAVCWVSCTSINGLKAECIVGVCEMRMRWGLEAASMKEICVTKQWHMIRPVLYRVLVCFITKGWWLEGWGVA